MSDGAPSRRVKAMFAGVQLTLLAVFLLVLAKSSGVVRSLSILLVAAGTFLVTAAIRG
jgi:hypothetical protein